MGGGEFSRGHAGEITLAPLSKEKPSRNNREGERAWQSRLAGSQAEMAPKSNG